MNDMDGRVRPPRAKRQDGRLAGGAVNRLLEGKTAVIYGGAGAIGSAVARRFAHEGAAVYLAGRTLAPLSGLAAELSALGGVARAAAVDALDGRAVERQVADVVERAGRIDVLFNAIGLEDVQGMPLLEMTFDQFVHPVTIAMRSHFHTARAAARWMVQQRSGVIMTVTAGPAREATANIGGFGVACEAIEALWRQLAAELGPYAVRVVGVRSAGSPDTPALRDVLALHAKTSGITPEDALAGAASGTLLGRLPMVDEVAQVASMLASDRASAVTGTFVDVTCGSRVD